MSDIQFSYPAASRGLSTDAQALINYDANKKSKFVAYLLWFFLGGFGVHRFYLRRPMSGLAMFALYVCGGLAFLANADVGTLLVGGVGIWLIVDAFLIPGIVRQFNTQIAWRPSTMRPSGPELDDTLSANYESAINDALKMRQREPTRTENTSSQQGFGRRQPRV